MIEQSTIISHSLPLPVLEQTTLETARGYLARGWMPLPVPICSKNPGFTGWQRFSVSADGLAEHFGGQKNIGVLLGEASGGLVDIDLDCPEAIALAPIFLPPTESVFGRSSKPRSHWLYRCDGMKTRKFADPIAVGDEPSKKRSAMLVEIRSDGCQTIMPGSVHPSGEAIGWSRAAGDPATVDAETLGRSVAKLAAAVSFARHWPSGSRHEASLAVAGGLIRARWTEGATSHFLEAVCRAANDEETAQRLQNVHSTAARFRQGEQITGWPSLARLLGDKVVNAVTGWLNIKAPKDIVTVARGSSHDWSEPVALPDELLPVPKLEPGLLPDSLRDWLEDIADRMQCPLEFPAIGALVAISSLLGNQICVQPKQFDDWTVSPNLWGGIVGRPGLLKTPALNDALKPLKARERIARDEHRRAMQDSGFRKLQAKVARKRVEVEMEKALKNKGDTDRFKDELRRTDADEPTERRYVINDTTTEKLGELLNQNPRGLLLFRDELPGWLKSLDRDGHEQDRAFYLEAWNGDGGFTYDRIGRGTVRVDSLTVSILGGIQPGPLQQYLFGAMRGGFGDDGLMQRFQLLVYPDDLRPWRNVDRKPDAKAAMVAHECFAKLDGLKPTSIGAMAINPANGTEYCFLKFDQEAQNFFDAWRADLETALSTESFEFSALEAHMAKYRSLMPSLALIFHLVEVATGNASGQIGLKPAMMAAAWCVFLEGHARRVYGMALTPEVRQAKAILSKIQAGRLAPNFTARTLCRNEWTGFKQTADVADALELLVTYGWLQKVNIGGTEKGGRSSVCYLAHPSIVPKVRDGEG